MPQGLLTFDEAGRLNTNLTDRLSKILGSFQTKTSGTLTDAKLKPAGVIVNPWYFAVPLNPNLGIFMGPNRSPNVTFNGTTMSWNFTATPSIFWRITYGVY